ncbi:P-type conjugative transfer protein TrbG [Croceicoccus estronivorus]|nr:P-type conjugative transfer protein TrbG [Croceicoccus estronivorus]
MIRSMLFPIVALACVPAQAHEGASPLRRVAVANRSATEQPAAQGFINATQVYAFSEGMIFQGYTAPGAVTDIALQPGEALVAVASGDTARWVIGDTTSGSGDTRRTHILVKPFNAGLITNLVITTDRRTYHLRLASTARTPMAAISWTYPQDELLALKRQAEAARSATPVAAGLDVDQLRFDYALSGDRPAWRPLRAFDDGQKTYIEFPSGLSQGEAPPLFVLGADGKAELANYRVRERYYIIDRLFDAAELRLGLKKQQVVRITRGARAKHRRGA